MMACSLGSLLFFEFAQLSIKCCTLICPTFKASFYLVLISTGQTPNVDYAVSLNLNSETGQVPQS